MEEDNLMSSLSGWLNDENIIFDMLHWKRLVCGGETHIPGEGCRVL